MINPVVTTQQSPPDIDGSLRTETPYSTAMDDNMYTSDPIEKSLTMTSNLSKIAVVPSTTIAPPQAAAAPAAAILEQCNNLLTTLQNKSDIERMEYNDTWKSCCLLLDKRATMFFSQLLIALLVIGFCIVQLVNSRSCEHDSLYSGILSMIIGVYLPQPRINR